jgi:hypothetical protein
VLDYTSNAPALNKDFFSVALSYHWTSTTNARTRNIAHVVDLRDAQSLTYGKAAKANVLAVRVNQSGSR